MNVPLLILLLVISAVTTGAYPSYTGYSGASGSKGTCASSCHGSGAGSIIVNGFPTRYTPGVSYIVTVKRNGGSLISNFNGSLRKGNSASGGGAFTAGKNAALYSVTGTESGVRAGTNNIDSAVFTWVAPTAGSGTITFTVSGLQGSKSGPTTKVVLTSVEEVASAAEETILPSGITLEQNFPNPFNPSTWITYAVTGKSAEVALKIYDLLGNEVTTVMHARREPGNYRIRFDAQALPSGAYFLVLRSGNVTQTRRMLLTK